MSDHGWDAALSGLEDATARIEALRHVTLNTPVSVVTEAESPDGRVWARLTDGKVTSLNMDEAWLAEHDADEVLGTIMQTMNAALERHQADVAEQLDELNPGLDSVRAMVTDARDTARAAFNSTVESAMKRIDQGESPR